MTEQPSLTFQQTSQLTKQDDGKLSLASTLVSAQNMARRVQAGNAASVRNHLFHGNVLTLFQTAPDDTLPHHHSMGERRYSTGGLEDPETMLNCTIARILRLQQLKQAAAAAAMEEELEIHKALHGQQKKRLLEQARLAQVHQEIRKAMLPVSAASVPAFPTTGRNTNIPDALLGELPPVPMGVHTSSLPSLAQAGVPLMRQEAPIHNSIFRNHVTSHPQPIRFSLSTSAQVTDMRLNASLASVSINAPQQEHQQEMSAIDDAESQEVEYGGSQAQQWEALYNQLRAYRQRHGNCLVPQHKADNLRLARWVKRQRYQYKLLKEGKLSNMTPDRVKALEEIGFVWDSHTSTWEERLQELKEFKKAHSHCNVPITFQPNPKLAAWVKCQRRQYKLFVDGESSNMTEKRIHKLESIGFEWRVRKGSSAAAA